ncbi:hypothetical protein CUMW_187640 [Citrus unshiu]|uniref:Uncharacterized protein n=1 Tax=Citrus unshiu TaxID=55188 RepID=A0A2H5Q1K0_CITUN|nr:hypothetical protein CUMW_187640 [Citrus unshiu]
MNSHETLTNNHKFLPTSLLLPYSAGKSDPGLKLRPAVQNQGIFEPAGIRLASACRLIDEIQNQGSLSLLHTISQPCGSLTKSSQAGHRVCLGKDIALVEMKSVALAVVRKFNIRVSDPNQAPQFAPGLTATVRGGLPVMVQERGD